MRGRARCPRRAPPPPRPASPQRRHRSPTTWPPSTPNSPSDHPAAAWRAICSSSWRCTSITRTPTTPTWWTSRTGA
eukprot:6039756-Prymnesium_polylepis.1